MKTLKKILYSIPAVVVLGAFIFQFSDEFHKTLTTMDLYHRFVFGVWVLYLVQYLLLVRILWSFKHIDRSIKSNWTWLLLIYGMITSFIFIWKRMDELEKENTSKETLDN